jgi:hypothetical protein
VVDLSERRRRPGWRAELDLAGKGEQHWDAKAERSQQQQSARAIASKLNDPIPHAVSVPDGGPDGRCLLSGCAERL